MALSFITDLVDPATISKDEQYTKNGPFVAKIFLPFNLMSWLAEEYPGLLAPNTGLPLLLSTFDSPPDTPSGTETPWYCVSCKVHPHQLEFRRAVRNDCENTAGELDSEKFALALPWDGSIELYVVIPFRFQIHRLTKFYSSIDVPTMPETPFPLAPGIASFAGPIDTLTYRLSPSLGLTDHQKKACGFIRLYTYFQTPNPNTPTYTGAHGFQVFVFIPTTKSPWAERYKRLRNANRFDSHGQ